MAGPFEPQVRQGNEGLCGPGGPAASLSWKSLAGRGFRARRWGIALASVVCVLGLTVAAGPARVAAEPVAEVADPVVTGPVTGGAQGHPQLDAPFRVADQGYEAAEYFVSGTAKSFVADVPPAAYATRIVVYRPTDPARFSGNVVLEWANTTGQIDAPVEFMWSYPQIFATGDVYVQVSAQQAGVCGMGLPGGPGPAICTPISLKGWDPVRYRDLIHPGDRYADDIFSQTVRAIRHPGPVAPLAGLAARHVIAIGESQSAIALDNYIRSGADRAAGVVDGFVIDADGHTAEPGTYRVPTVTVWSEESARPDPVIAANHVTWSVAGAAHTDHWLLADATGWAGHSLLGAPLRTAAEQDAQEHAAGDYGQEGPGASLTCAGDDEFPRRYVVDAAIADVEDWLDTGTPAPDSPPLRFTGADRAPEPLPAIGNALAALTGAIDPELGGLDILGILGAPGALARDGDGNALGGLRLPPVSVPVAGYDGSACIAAGTTAPLTPDRLHRRYPTHADYVAQVVAATEEAVARRYLTVRDAVDFLGRACDSAIPDFGTTPAEQQPAECHHPESLPR
ncbi:alpha/beta hydrolase domain-containing protein [Nocardia sp. BMG111209]|uniref:alpha/beta hydrolase domain-containing protein n=1 Tax=Nocardia sp. BMG111209 TaxID=1160137 RepID=UPI0003A09A41|nr:alpha/beta hydrolase domain-containing protein [Nocardia sp. BMG111209]